MMYIAVSDMHHVRIISSLQSALSREIATERIVITVVILVAIIIVAIVMLEIVVIIIIAVTNNDNDNDNNNNNNNDNNDNNSATASRRRPGPCCWRTTLRWSAARAAAFPERPRSLNSVLILLISRSGPDL